MNKKPSLAVALNTRRLSKKKKAHKMAEGGMVPKADKPLNDPAYLDRNKKDIERTFKQDPDSIGAKMARMADKYLKPGSYAHGGLVDSVADAIMRKRKLADGQVDIAQNQMEMPNYYDELNEETAFDSYADASEVPDQPEDSNEIGDDIEKDKHDRIAQMRRRIKKKVV